MYKRGSTSVRFQRSRGDNKDLTMDMCAGAENWGPRPVQCAKKINFLLGAVSLGILAAFVGPLFFFNSSSFLFFS